MTTITDLVSEVNIKTSNLLTDKHKTGFCAIYDNIFKPYKDTAKLILEVGINRGGSVWVWENYFNSATIYGADVTDGRVCRGLEFNRYKYVYVDLNKIETIDSLATLHNDWDIIIDDASHSWSHQRILFEKMFPLVRAGGLYIVEDIETSYTRDTPARQETPPCPSFVRYLKDEVMDDVIKGKNNIKSITFYPDLVVFKK